MSVMVSEVILKKAFKILRRNYACPGHDGLTMQTVKSNYVSHSAIVSSAISSGNTTIMHCYEKRNIIDYKGNNRPIFVYSIYARWIQEYLKILLESRIAEYIQPYVFGFRRSKKDNDIFEYILKFNPIRVLYVDIKSYYSSINIKSLKRMLENMNIDALTIQLVSIAIQNDESSLPAGNALSPLLANAYLTTFDCLFPNGYARFADDMYFFGINNAIESNSLLLKIKDELLKLHLYLNETKTRKITTPNKNNIYPIQ